MKGLVVSLFDYTTIMVMPWAEAGYDCVVVDIKHQGRPTFGYPAWLC